MDKLLNISDRVASLAHIVYADPRGMRKYDDARLLPLNALLKLGEALAVQQPGLHARMVAATRGEDIAILCTTSGTTARPKLAMLTAARRSVTAPRI